MNVCNGFEMCLPWPNWISTLLVWWLTILLVVDSSLHGISMQSLRHHWKLLPASIFHDNRSFCMCVFDHYHLGMFVDSCMCLVIFRSLSLVFGLVHVDWHVVFGRIWNWNEFGCRSWHVMVLYNIFLTGNYAIDTLYVLNHCLWIFREMPTKLAVV